MILGFIPIDTAYAIVLGATAFCVGLAGIAWVVHRIIDWNTERKLFKAYMELHGGNDDSTKDKS